MANQTKNFYEAYQGFFVGGGGSVTPTPEVEEAIQNLQQAYNALQEQVNQLPTEDTDTIFDPTPINEALQSLQQEIQDNGTLDLSNITTLQNAITALQEQVNQLPTEDTDTVFDPTPLNESISVLQTSLQQFREQAEIAQAQQAAALAANTELDAQQQQSITNLTSRVTALEDAPIQTKIIGYQQATAQEIISFLENNPHAPVLVKNGDDIYTSIFSKILADNKVMLRTVASLQGKFTLLEYTVTDTSWNATTAPLYYDDTELSLLIAQNKRNIDRIADKVGIDLTYEYLPLAANQGVIIDDGVGVDTGLTLDGDVSFTFKGCLKDDQHQVCVMGARTGTSTTERTCINVLPQSGKVQSQWANNAYKVLKDDVSFTQPFEVAANSDYTDIIQNGVAIATIQNGGFTGTNTATPICLFNQALDNEQYYSPVLQYADIYKGGITTTFEPKIKRNTITGEENVVLLKNGVDMNIGGLTLFEIQVA